MYVIRLSGGLSTITKTLPDSKGGGSHVNPGNTWKVHFLARRLCVADDEILPGQWSQFYCPRELRAQRRQKRGSEFFRVQADAIR